MLVLADFLATCVALGAALAIVGDIRAPALVVPFVAVGLAKLFGLYDRDELLIRKTTMDEGPQLFQLATLMTLLVALGDKRLGGIDFGGQVLVVLWAVQLVASVLLRAAARSVAKRGSKTERILLIGSWDVQQRLDSKLGESGLNARIVARLALQSDSQLASRLSSESELAELVRWMDVDRVIIEPQGLPDADMLDFVRAAKGIGVRVSLVPRVLDVVGSSVVFDEIHGVTLLGVRRFGLSRSSWLVKRTFDVVGAGLLTFASAPLMAVIAIAVKLDSRGPVLFAQTRVGRDGKPFRICKFRTMDPDAEARKGSLRHHSAELGGMFKLEDDPRVTRVGAFLRKTSLDEIPQLFNVLGGSMSLVGPRPLVVDEDAHVKGFDRRCLHLTPGMTGVWQILGSGRVPLQEMVKLDYLYVAGWSLWSDLKILLRTVPYVLGRRGL